MLRAEIFDPLDRAPPGKFGEQRVDIEFGRCERLDVRRHLCNRPLLAQTEQQVQTLVDALGEVTLAKVSEIGTYQEAGLIDPHSTLPFSPDRCWRGVLVDECNAQQVVLVRSDALRQGLAPHAHELSS